MGNDTSEKVRADMHAAIGALVEKALKCEPDTVLFWTPEDFDVFLNRQADITRRECSESKQAEDSERWISVTEAADILGVHRNRVLQLANDGALDAHKVGQRWNISKASVESRAANPPKAGRRW